MIAAICRALRLSQMRPAYLHHLAGEVPGPPPGPVRDVRPGLLHLLDRLDDTPAMVCDAKYDVLAWNAMAAALITDFTVLPPGERNIIGASSPTRRCAAGTTPTAPGGSPASRWPICARQRPGTPAMAASGRWSACPAASAEFRGLWAERDVQARRSARKRLRHPVVGWLDLDCEALHDPDRDQWVVLYTAPPGTPSHEALRLLRDSGTPGLWSALSRPWGTPVRASGA